ncbi:MAG: helix-turn-helix domain-containing protein [Vicinamibacteria bacterium]
MSASTVTAREHAVHPALAPYVKSLWSLESEGALCGEARERILPDSCVELVFHFHDPYRSHFANGDSALQPRSFVVGQMKRFLEIEPSGRAGFVAVRFFARGAYLFFRRPLREVAAGVVDLGDLWRSRAREWTERIALAEDTPARVRLVEEALLALLRESGRTEPAVDRALHLIEASRGQVRVEALAAEIGVSQRQLSRHFERAVGLSPKEFGRVTRFLHALELVAARKHTALADVAADCGYFDQAHFNHDFREMAGMSPGELATFPNVSF